MLSTATLLSDYQRQQVAQLRQFLLWMLPIAFSMSALQLIAGVVTASSIVSISAAPTFCFGLLMFLALWYVSHSRLSPAAITICVAFFAVAIALFFILPAVLPVLVLGPILATVVTLPYISSRTLLSLSVVAWMMLTLFTVLSRVMTPFAPPSQLAVDVIMISAMTVVAPMLLLLLWQFHSRLTEALAHALAANASLQAAMAEAQAARASAEQASELKTQFLANMSHELRTPLNSIINFTRILNAGLRGPVTPEQRDYLSRVRQSGEHLLGLINDILDLSKIESGRMELYTEPVQVAELIQGVLATTAGLTKDKPIELHQELAPHLPPVAADRTRLRQILLNLLSNAAKFTASGAITVRAQHTGEHLVLSVSDTGIGIAPEHLVTIFEEFRQLEGSANRRYEGTGLGLAICRRLVELHGGQLWVESTLGVGSTFAFSLPIVPSVPASLATLATSTSVGIPVLVVDDDPAAIEIVAAYLERDGYAVYGLTDSRQVLEAARLVRPAAIILDVMMPHKDGWEVLGELKAEPELQVVPVALYTIVEEQKLGFYLGASAYLTKPIDADQLRTALGRLVGVDATILLIDDDPDTCEIVTQQLEQVGGYHVLVAGGGQSGLAQVAVVQPDLIILDLMMPEVDGFAVLEALERGAETRGIPVIVLTSKELSVHERAYLQQRVRGLLRKGITSPEQLLGRVRALLAGERPLITIAREKE
jgi:signal transduction histidine kinase/CheY-like chemotaxis protein